MACQGQGHQLVMQCCSIQLRVRGSITSYFHEVERQPALAWGVMPGVHSEGIRMLYFQAGLKPNGSTRCKRAHACVSSCVNFTFSDVPKCRASRLSILYDKQLQRCRSTFTATPAAVGKACAQKFAGHMHICAHHSNFESKFPDLD